MQLTYKHIVLALLVIAIIYFITRDNNIDGFQDEEQQQEVVDNIVFNADRFLMQLDDTQRKELLHSNKVMQWVKFMERDQANLLFNELFDNRDNADSYIGNLIDQYIDPKISEVMSEDQSTNVGLYNKAKEELKQNTNNEIKTYGENFGILKTENGLTLPSNTDLKNNIDIFLGDEKNNFASNLNVKFKGANVTFESKNKTKPTLESLINAGVNTGNINLDNFPSELKYRVRNNRKYIAIAIANILNSIALQKGYEWKKINVNGDIITDTTVNPDTIFNQKKSKIIKLMDSSLEDVARPLNILPLQFSNSKKRHVYNLLLNLNVKEYDSEDVTLENNFTNSLGQNVWSEPGKVASIDDHANYENKITNILEHSKIENEFVLNPVKFIRNSPKFNLYKRKLNQNNDEYKPDELGLPLYMYDPYPEPVNSPNVIDRSNKDKTGKLEEGEIISISKVELQDGNEVITSSEILKKENGLYYVKDDNNDWINKVFSNQFTWNISALEVLGKKLVGNEDKNELRFDIIALNTVLGEIGERNAVDLFYHSDDKTLPLPIKYIDPYPLKWKGTSQRNYALNESLGVDVNPEVVVFNRMKISNEDLIPSSNTGALQDDEVIVGQNNNILVKIVEENGVRKYTDASGLEYPNIDITENTGKIGWKVNFLREYFENTDSVIIKKELTILNLLILAKGKAENKRKFKLLPTLPRNKVSLVIKNPPLDSNNNKITSDVLSEDDKNACYESIANGLSDYNIIKSGAALIMSADSVKNMNRLNLASIVENGIQRVERLVILKQCISKSQYPNGDVLLDAELKEIKFIYMADIIRLQKAIFGAFNGYIEPEDGLKDIIYASYRLRLILQAKQDYAGKFLIDRATPLDQIIIKSLIEKLFNVNFDIVHPDDGLSINEHITSKGITLERLNKVYQYMSIDDYLSVKLNLSLDPDALDSVYQQIDENKVTIRDNLCETKKEEYFNSGLEGIAESLLKNNTDTDISEKEISDKVCELKLSYNCEVSDDDILRKYNYINAINAINAVKDRLFSMTTEKKTVILNTIKENIKNRQNASDNDLKVEIEDYVNLNTTFKDLKMLHFDARKVIPEQIVEEQPVEEPFTNFSIGGYNRNNMYSSF